MTGSMAQIVKTGLLALLGILLVNCASPNAAQEAREAQAMSDKRIALTFDDTPRHPGAFFDEDERTERLIKQLRDAGVAQAAFFLNPAKITERPGAEERIAAYVAAGHVIANHTADHPRLSQTETSAYIAEIDLAGAWLKDRPGTRAWFRYPYLDEGRDDLAKRDAVRAALKTRGLLNASPTVDASDWFTDNELNRAKRSGEPFDLAAAGRIFVESHVEAAEFYDRLARETYGRPIAHNMLLHETDLSAMFIGDLVNALKAKGWTIITADEAFADPAFLAAPDVPSAQGTLVELAAWHKGIGSQRWYPGNDTAKLGERFNREVLGTGELKQEPAQ